MSELSPADIAARVVAWHNRHPLARRLRAADVHSIGHVALPFALGAGTGAGAGAAASAPPTLTSEVGAGAGGSLRERAMARAREAPAGAAAPPAPTPADTAAGGAAGLAPRPAFREDFIAPLSPAEVGAFAGKHGIARAAEPAGAPVRRVPATPGTGPVAWRWVLTAELRGGSARTRVLLGPAPGAPVLGRRLWSLPRVGGLAALAGAGAALVLALGLFDAAVPPVAVLPGAVPATTSPAPSPPPAPASAAASAMALGSAPASAAVGGPGLAVAAVPASASAPAPQAAASRPLDVAPRLGRVELPPIGGIVDARRREAAERAAAAASAAAASAPAAAPTGTAATAAARAPAAAASAPVFALTTRLLRTRTESRQIAEALTALLVVPGSPVQRVDVLPAGDDFRVVAWPYPGRAEAERAQAALQARGHRLQVISF